jgi:ATP-dependent Clp protease ATP-binding subunit ClpX
MKRVMFEVPSMPEVTKCIVNRESVLSTGEPILKNEADQDIQLKS